MIFKNMRLLKYFILKKLHFKLHLCFSQKFYLIQNYKLEKNMFHVHEKHKHEFENVSLCGMKIKLNTKKKSNCFQFKKPALYNRNALKITETQLILNKKMGTCLGYIKYLICFNLTNKFIDIFPFIPFTLREIHLRGPQNLEITKINCNFIMDL